MVFLEHTLIRSLFQSWRQRIPCAYISRGWSRSSFEFQTIFKYLSMVGHLSKCV